MDTTNIAIEVEANRYRIADRIARAAEPRIPATAHRHLLAQRLRRIADRVDT